MATTITREIKADFASELERCTEIKPLSRKLRDKLIAWWIAPNGVDIKPIFISLIQKDKSGELLLGALCNQELMKKLSLNEQDILEILDLLQERLLYKTTEQCPEKYFLPWLSIFDKLLSALAFGASTWPSVKEKAREILCSLSIKKDKEVEDLRKIIDAKIGDPSAAQQLVTSVSSATLQPVTSQPAIIVQQSLRYVVNFNGTALDTGVANILDARTRHCYASGQKILQITGPGGLGKDAINIAKEAFEHFKAQLIHDLKQRTKLSSDGVELSLFGFSRGSVNALRFSNYLQAWVEDTGETGARAELSKECPFLATADLQVWLNQLSIHATLYDLVAGQQVKLAGIPVSADGYADVEGHTIPKCVKRAHIIYSRDELRNMMEPLPPSKIKISDATSTKVIYDTTPGPHNFGSCYAAFTPERKKFLQLLDDIIGSKTGNALDLVIHAIREFGSQPKNKKFASELLGQIIPQLMEHYKTLEYKNGNTRLFLTANNRDKENPLPQWRSEIILPQTQNSMLSSIFTCLNLARLWQKTFENSTPKDATTNVLGRCKNGRQIAGIYVPPNSFFQNEFEANLILEFFPKLHKAAYDSVYFEDKVLCKWQCDPERAAFFQEAIDLAKLSPDYFRGFCANFMQQKQIKDPIVATRWINWIEDVIKAATTPSMLNSRSSFFSKCTTVPKEISAEKHLIPQKMGAM
ncbi:MAG: hypothetical protein WCW01_04050 [Gammaproteobacteria bacterium]